MRVSRVPRVCLLLIASTFTLAGCASEGVNLARVRCRPIQKLGSFEGVAFGADIDTTGFAGRQLVYQVVLLGGDGRPIRSIDGRFQNSAGAVSASRTLMVFRSPQAFPNARLTIPADELEVFEDDLPVTAVFTLSLADGTPLANARRRVPLSQPTEGLMQSPPPPEAPEPPPEPQRADAETADAPNEEIASADPEPDTILATQPAEPPPPPERSFAGKSSLSEDEAAAIAALFHESLLAAGKSAENPPENKVDVVTSRPIMALAESAGAERRADSEQNEVRAPTSRPAEAVGKVGCVPHVVREGETLSSIAEKHYGATSFWMRIYEANRDVLYSPDLIRPGMKLNVPVGDYVQKQGDADQD